MAGSYSHLAGIEGGIDLIENMGDAKEAIEQLLWLVFRLDGGNEAERLLDSEYYPMLRGELTPDAPFIRARRIMETD